jgi:hypothetical protein
MLDRAVYFILYHSGWFSLAVFCAFLLLALLSYLGQLRRTSAGDLVARILAFFSVAVIFLGVIVYFVAASYSVNTYAPAGWMKKLPAQEVQFFQRGMKLHQYNAMTIQHFVYFKNLYHQDGG